LAIARPDVDFVLIEPMERRVSWLQEQTEALRLDNVEVLRARAEDVRLPAPLDREAEADAAVKESRRFHLRDVRVEILGAGVVDEVTRVIRATVR
jgi:16S rRNA (guanine527-N7)-methyltransferase